LRFLTGEAYTFLGGKERSLMILEIRDPIHGFVRLQEKEVKILNSPAMQRLRRIRQLALACQVYPGAVHTRFDHSIGVTHIAGLMAKAIQLDIDETELVRSAALLHDLGHGPYSHISELALERYAKRDSLQSDQKKEKIHELVTALMIRSDEQIVRILGADKCDQIVNLLSKGHGQRVLKSVVSGPLDADKQDYLLRDSYFCGVRYGVFDIHQFHRSLIPHGPPDDKELMIKEGGVHAIEQYVLAKYYLTFNVYRHKVRLISDEMITRAITLGIEKDHIKSLYDLYAFDNSAEFARRYAEWDDLRFEYEFGRSTTKTRCRLMLERLRERRLLKRIFTKNLRELEPRLREFLPYLSKRGFASERESAEAEIAGLLKTVTGGQAINKDQVIVHSLSFESARTVSRNDERGIQILKAEGPKSFDEESTLFRSIDEKFVEEYVEVYAPVEWSTPTDKGRIRRECEPKIISILDKTARDIGERRKKEGKNANL
jgi:HD superfamily phosphohydrolase